MKRTRKRTPVLVRFWRHVRRIENGCWRWTGGSDKKGYGRFRDENSKSVSAHRWAYERFFGELVPEELQVDHLCFNTWCVNPDHLEIVTNEENARRAAAALTHCVHGHPWDEENTREKKTRDGKTERVCRTCHRNREAIRREKRRKYVN